ncbi:MAG TPA: hypothetical protein VIQ31_30675 [Phormidium sp.]
MPTAGYANAFSILFFGWCDRTLLLLLIIFLFNIRPAIETKQYSILSN